MQQSPPTAKTPSDRLAASHALEVWLRRGGPSPVPFPRARDLPPLLHVSPAFKIVGTRDNISVTCTRAVPAGTFAYGVAMHSVLHPMSDAIPAPWRRIAADVANNIRKLRVGGTGLLGSADDACRIDLIVLLALEILAGEASKWAPYIASLPQLEDAAPPSLWRYLDPPNAAATALLYGTSMAPKLSCDDLELEALFGQPPDQQSDEQEAEPSEMHVHQAPLAQAREIDFAAGKAIITDIASAARAAINASSCAPAVTTRDARHALLRAVGLVSTRMFGGIGMVPLLDLANGAPGLGGIATDTIPLHNATIERTQLAASQHAKETAPCVAIVTNRPLAAGDELVVGYGKLSAAEFLYKYGWVIGGPDKAAPAPSPFDDSIALRPPSLWAGLTDGQRSVLDRYGLTSQKLGLDDAEPWRPAALEAPAVQAAQGKTDPTMRQLALIACIDKDATLAEVAKTGKLKAAGVEANAINRRIARWVVAQAAALAEGQHPSDASSTVTSWRARLAMRVAHSERVALLNWARALREKLGSAGDGELEEELEMAEKAHKIETKRMKAAVKHATAA